MADALVVNAPKLLVKAADVNAGGVKAVDAKAGADKKDAAKDLPNGDAKNPDVGEFNPFLKRAPVVVHVNKPTAQETVEALGKLMLEDISKKEPKKDERQFMSGIE